MKGLSFVTPAQAGVHGSAGKPRPAWIPAFAGMTKGARVPFGNGIGSSV
jgi:hypothetical protein